MSVTQQTLGSGTTIEGAFYAFTNDPMSFYVDPVFTTNTGATITYESYVDIILSSYSPAGYYSNGNIVRYYDGATTLSAATFPQYSEYLSGCCDNKIYKLKSNTSLLLGTVIYIPPVNFCYTVVEGPTIPSSYDILIDDNGFGIITPDSDCDAVECEPCPITSYDCTCYTVEPEVGSLFALGSYVGCFDPITVFTPYSVFSGQTLQICAKTGLIFPAGVQNIYTGSSCLSISGCCDTEEVPGITINDCDPITLLPLGIICSGINPTEQNPSSGELTILITGGTNPYTVVWTLPNGNTVTGQTISNQEEGEYYVEVRDVYNDFSASTTCTLQIYRDCTFSGSVIEFILPTPTPGPTATPAPTPEPTICITRPPTPTPSSTPTPTPTPVLCDVTVSLTKSSSPNVAGTIVDIESTPPTTLFSWTPSTSTTTTTIQAILGHTLQVGALASGCTTGQNSQITITFVDNGVSTTHTWLSNGLAPNPEDLALKIENCNNNYQIQIVLNCV